MKVRFVKNCVKAKAVTLLGIHDPGTSGWTQKSQDINSKKARIFFLFSKTKRGTE